MGQWPLEGLETLQQVNNFIYIFPANEFLLIIKRAFLKHGCSDYRGRHQAHYWLHACRVRQCKTITHPSLGSTSGTAGLQPSALGGIVGWGWGGCLIPSGGSRVSGSSIPPSLSMPQVIDLDAQEAWRWKCSAGIHTVGGRRSFFLGVSTACFHMMWNSFITVQQMSQG